MLEIRNIHKSYGGNQVLKGVDINVEKGDVIVILGPSGSGKTTLLRCINFLERADKGTLDFEEIHTEFKNASRGTINKIRKKTAFVFQNYNLFQNKTALQNVMEGLTVARKVPKAEAAKIAKEALDKVGLSDRYDYYPSQLSGGQQQRVLLARALCAAQKILLLDEPVSGLDPRVTAEMYQLIKDLNKKDGITIIMISHDIAAAVKYATHILHIGEHCFFGTKKQYLESSLGKAFTGQEEEE